VHQLNQVLRKNNTNTYNSTDEFYRFLYCKYFVWKFGAKKSVLKDMQKLLSTYEKEHVHELDTIHKELFSFNKNDIRKGLEIATKAHGLGVIGASGLLAVLFPEYFGTLDKFMVAN